MSYRETKVFIEKLRILGYSSSEYPINFQSFKQPNFPLMAKIVQWLIELYDPEVKLPSDISDEQGRISFVKAVVLLMITKSQLKLNPRKLYEADGHAVQEMLKIVNMVYETSISNSKDDEYGDFVLSYDISRHAAILKSCKQVAMDIIKKSPEIYDLLDKETDLRESRNWVISKQLDMASVETHVKEKIKEVQEQSNTMETTLLSLKSEQADLLSKLEKKKAEFERREKRFKSLQGVRPAFMDEYERHENELRKLYAQYVNKFRNILYLEHCVHQLTEKEMDLMKERQVEMKKWLAQIQQEEVKMLRDDVFTAEESQNFISTFTNKPEQKPLKKVFGSMSGGEGDEEDDEQTIVNHPPTNVQLDIDEDQVANDIYQF